MSRKDSLAAILLPPVQRQSKILPQVQYSILIHSV